MVKVWILDIHEERPSMVVEKVQWFGVVFLVLVELDPSIEQMALRINNNAIYLMDVNGNDNMPLP